MLDSRDCGDDVKKRDCCDSPVCRGRVRLVDSPARARPRCSDCILVFVCGSDLSPMQCDKKPRLVVINPACRSWWVAGIMKRVPVLQMALEYAVLHEITEEKTRQVLVIMRRSLLLENNPDSDWIPRTTPNIKWISSHILRHTSNHIYRQALVKVALCSTELAASGRTADSE